MPKPITPTSEQLVVLAMANPAHKFCIETCPQDVAIKPSGGPIKATCSCGATIKAASARCEKCGQMKALHALVAASKWQCPPLEYLPWVQQPQVVAP